MIGLHARCNLFPAAFMLHVQSANCLVVQLVGSRWLFSDGVLVAGYIEGGGFVRSSVRYSHTTLRQVNQFCGGRGLGDQWDARALAVRLAQSLAESAAAIIAGGGAAD